MKDDLDLVRGSGDIFCDFGRGSANLEQARAIVAAKIIRTLDKRGLSTREAQQLTGVSHSEFSRIRNSRLTSFTLDRMISILGKLDIEIEVNISFKSNCHTSQEAAFQPRKVAARCRSHKCP